MREAPLVQEILTFLGSFVRAEPHLFDGILRVRSHYILLAMREEISRIRSCDKESAVEYLMEMSPSEMKSLLGLVLSAKNETIKQRWRSKLNSPCHSEGEEDTKKLSLLVQSGGFNDGNFSKMEVNGQTISHGERGLNVVAIHPKDGRFLEVKSFDTHHSEEQSDALARMILGLEEGVCVLFSGKDEFSECLNQNAKEALEMLGSQTIRKVGYRDSWCMIAIAGHPSHCSESHKPAKNGPSDPLSFALTLQPRPAHDGSTHAMF